MYSENDLVFMKLKVKINKAGNVSVITNGDYGKTFKETGWGYDLLSEAFSRAVEDRINFKEAKQLVQSNNSFMGMEKLAERLNGTFTIEEQDKNEYICFLTLEKKYFYSDEFLCEKRLLENTKSIKVLTKLANSKFDEIKLKVIIHPNTNFNILDKLSKDENSYISEKAKIGLNKQMKSKTMNNFRVIEKNIKKVLLNKKWLVNVGCDDQYALNYKVAINFETNEVFTMEENCYMAGYNGGFDDNVKYFNIPDFKYIQDDFEMAKQRGWLNKKDSFHKYIYNKLEQSPEWKIEELITDFINEVKEDYKIALEEEDFCF